MAEIVNGPPAAAVIAPVAAPAPPLVDPKLFDCLQTAWNDDCTKPAATFPGSPLPFSFLVAIGRRRAGPWMFGFVAAILSTVVGLGTHLTLGFDPRVVPLVFGAAVGAGVGAGLAYLAGQVKTACSTYPDQVDEIRERVREAIARLDSSTIGTKPQADVAKNVVNLLCGILTRLDEPGPQWLDASGFLGLWVDLHKAENNCMLIEAEQQVVGSARYDLLRLDSSKIPTKATLTKELKDALDPLPLTDVARQQIQSVRMAINEFREQQWAQIVSSRNGLLTLGAFAMGIGYAIVFLAVGFSAAAGALGSGLVYALVAALVSETNQLQFRANAPNDVEDFGFSTVKAVVTPVIAALAAVLAVVFFTQFQLVFSGQTLGGAFTSWQETFNWRHNPTALAIAILVGFAPSLFFTVLQNKVNDAISGIKSTQASGGGG